MLPWLKNACTKMSLHIGLLFVCLVVSTSVHASPPFPVKSGRILNPVVLLTGGYPPVNNDELAVEVFSPWQNSSCNKDLEDLSKGRVGHTLNFFKGDVIMCGGFYDTQKDCQSLDQNQRFIPHSQLNKRRTFHTAAVVKDTLLVVGGVGKSKSMESWNGSQWITQEINSEEVKDVIMFACMAAVSKDTILMTGGIITNKMFKYKNGVWERMEDFPGPKRGSHGCTFVETPEGDSFLIAGGNDKEETVLDTSYLYNIEKRQWEEVGKLASPRSDGKIVAIDGRILFLGGYAESYAESFNSNVLVDVEEYNVEKKTWTTIKQKIKRGRKYFDAVVIPGDLVGC